MLLQELLRLYVNEEVGQHTSPDGIVKVTLDMDYGGGDRGMTVFVKGATSLDQAQEIVSDHSDFINELLKPYDLSMWDAEVVHDEAVEGGWEAEMKLPAEENDDEGEDE